MSDLKVDRREIATFVDVLFRYCDPGGHIALRAFMDRADGAWRTDLWSAPRISDHGLGDCITAACALAEAAAANDEPVVFCPPIATFKTGNGAAEKDVLNGPALSVDCDARPERSRELLEDILGPPTIVVASGGTWTDLETGAVQEKVHLHYRLTEPAREFADLIKLKVARDLAMRLVGADASAVPAVHPFRWPGSWHRKAEPRLARIINLRDVEIELTDALERLREAADAGPAPTNGADRTAGTYTGQAGHKPSAFGAEADAIDINSALAAIPNTERNWKRWSDIGMATWRAGDGSEAAYAAYLAWSSKFEGCDPDACRERWDHFAKHPPNAIGAGTLFYWARQAWPDWERPSETRRRLANDPGEPPPHIVEPEIPVDEPVPTPAARPTLRVIAGELPAVVDAAEAILITRDRELYEFADQVMRPAVAPIRIADNKKAVGLRLLPVKLFHTIERFTRVIEFQKYSRQREQWEATDCPEPVAKAYLERVGAWRLPRLAAITSTPVLLHDGRIISQPGFDRASGTLFDPQGIIFPPIPARPTKDEARQALALLTGLFTEFPFVDASSRSVLYSGLLSSVARTAFAFAPLHGYDAPVAGTGKTKLVDCTAVLATGHECPVISQGADEVEFEKRLGAELLEGGSVISIDNCDAALGGQLLCQAVTQPFLKIRVLGFSKMVTVTNNVLIFATGNNLQFYGDMLRRGLRGHLDAGVERPELRTFDNEDPIVTLKRERARYAVAALTVLHAYNIAGRPDPPAPLGGFEGWSDLVRGALLWLDQADPVETIETARSDDPEQQRLQAVIMRWQQALGDRTLTARAVIEEACGFTLTPAANRPNHITYRHPEFRNALLDVANERGEISVARLGKWLSKNKHKVVGKYRLAAGTISAGERRWRLEERQPDGTWR